MKPLVDASLCVAGCIFSHTLRVRSGSAVRPALFQSLQPQTPTAEKETIIVTPHGLLWREGRVDILYNFPLRVRPSVPRSASRLQTCCNALRLVELREPMRSSHLSD